MRATDRAMTCILLLPSEDIMHGTQDGSLVWIPQFLVT